MHLTSPAFTNTSISNAYKGTNQVSKIMLGLNYVWPQAPVFSFDTYQAGGDLNLRVVSDTPYVACTVNDSDTFLFKSFDMTWGADSSIQAINLNATAYNKQYQLDSDTNVIDINIPLYQRKKVKITGRPSRSSTYIADTSDGVINVEIENPSATSIVFTISVTGETSITKTATSGSRNLFSFPNLSAGTKTVTINNLTDGVINTTSVVIGIAAIFVTALVPTQILNLGDIIAGGSAISTILTTVKVYSLTEEEASRLLSDQVLDLTQGVWINNLLFNNVDLIGNLRSADLKDINVNSISAIAQQKLQVIRSKDIITSTSMTYNTNVRIINTPLFKSTHGPETTYNYLGAHKLQLMSNSASLMPVGMTANNYKFKARFLNPHVKGGSVYLQLRIYDEQGNPVSDIIYADEAGDVPNDPIFYPHTGGRWITLPPGVWSTTQTDVFESYGVLELEFSGSFGTLTHTTPKKLFIGVRSGAAADSTYNEGSIGGPTILDWIEIISPPIYDQTAVGNIWNGDLQYLNASRYVGGIPSGITMLHDGSYKVYEYKP